jgi:hypothetical protein
MPVGVHLRLYNGSTATANLTGIQALWWDVMEPRQAGAPIGRSTLAATDADGDISLDLSEVTGLTVGDSGLLMLYKLDQDDHRNSLTFVGRMEVSLIDAGVSMAAVIEMTDDLEMLDNLEVR